MKYHIRFNSNTSFLTCKQIHSKLLPNVSENRTKMITISNSTMFSKIWQLSHCLAEAIRTTVVPIRILIRTTVVPITPLIGTTVVRIRILIGTTGILDFLLSLIMLYFEFSWSVLFKTMFYSCMVDYNCF